MAKRRSGRMLAAALLLPLAGCAAQAPCLFGSCGKSASRPPARPDPSYRVAAGDLLEIETSQSKAPLVAEVQPDGRIEIGNAADLRVDGMTTDEISVQLASYNPDLDPKVKVREYNSQFLYVFGEKDREEPQALPYRGKESVVDLMHRVGCRSCRLGYRVRVVRPAATIGAVPDVYTLRLDPAMKIRTGDAEANLPTGGLSLEPGDYVYIERDMAETNSTKWWQSKPESKSWIQRFHRPSEKFPSWVKR